MLRALLPLVGLLLAGAASCSSDDASPASDPASGTSGVAGASGSAGLGGAAGAAGTSGSSGASGAGGASGPCANDPDPPSAGTTCIEQVSGVARALDGSALPANTLVTVCGVACFYGKTDATGAFTAKMGVNIVVSDYVTYVHGQPAFANLLTRLPADAAGPSIVLSQPLLVPPLPAPAAPPSPVEPPAPAAPLAPVAGAEAGDGSSEELHAAAPARRRPARARRVRCTSAPYVTERVRAALACGKSSWSGQRSAGNPAPRTTGPHHSSRKRLRSSM